MNRVDRLQQEVGEAAALDPPIPHVRRERQVHRPDEGPCDVVRHEIVRREAGNGATLLLGDRGPHDEIHDGLDRETDEGEECGSDTNGGCNSSPPVFGTITCDGPALPIPPDIDGTRIREVVDGLPATPIEEGLRETMKRFRALRDAGRLDLRDLEA